jgi:gas vesicle protein
MCERNGNLLGLSLSFVVGATLGAGLALLFAPASGYETRKRIKDYGDKAMDSVKEKGADVISKVKGKLHREESPAEA